MIDEYQFQELFLLSLKFVMANSLFHPKEKYNLLLARVMGTGQSKIHSREKKWLYIPY